MSFDKRLQKAKQEVQDKLEQERLAVSRHLAQVQLRQQQEKQEILDIRSLPEFQQVAAFAKDSELKQAILKYWEHFRPTIERRSRFRTVPEFPQYHLDRTCFFPQMTSKGPFSPFIYSYNRGNNILAIAKVRLYYADPYADSVLIAGENHKFTGMLYLEICLTHDRQIGFDLLDGVKSLDFYGENQERSFQSFVHFDEVLDQIAMRIATNRPLWERGKFNAWFPYQRKDVEQPL